MINISGGKVSSDLKYIRYNFAASAQCLRHCSGIVQMLCGCFVFAGYRPYCHSDIILSYLQFSLFRDHRKKVNIKKVVIFQCEENAPDLSVT